MSSWKSEIDDHKGLLYAMMSIAGRAGRSGSMKGTSLPELLQILDPDTIITLVRVFSGKTITIPKLTDFRVTLLAGLHLYLYYVKGVSGYKSREILKDLCDGDMKMVNKICGVSWRWVKENGGKQEIRPLLKRLTDSHERHFTKKDHRDFE